MSLLDYQIGTIYDPVPTLTGPHELIQIELSKTITNFVFKHTVTGVESTVPGAIILEGEVPGSSGGGGSAGPDLAMVGASAIAAGVKGDVPAPAIGDHLKVLFGDGTWKTISNSELVPPGGGEQDTGQTFNGDQIFTQTFSGTTGSASSYAIILPAPNFNRIINMTAIKLVRANGIEHSTPSTGFANEFYSFEKDNFGNFSVWAEGPAFLFSSRPFEVTLQYTK